MAKTVEGAETIADRTTDLTNHAPAFGFRSLKGTSSAGRDFTLALIMS